LVAGDNSLPSGDWATENALYVTPQGREAAISDGLKVHLQDDVTLTYWAAQYDKIDLLKVLLQTHKVDVVSCDRRGRTALSIAATEGWVEVVKLLLWTGKVDINNRDDLGRTPLAWAASRGHAAVVSLLLDTGKVDIEAPTIFGQQTPLSLAALNGRAAVVKLLLQTRKVDIESSDWCAWTPICWALFNSHEAVVELLFSSWIANMMSKGRTLDVKRLGLHNEDDYRRTPLQCTLPEDDAVKVAKFLATRDEVCLQVTTHSHAIAENETPTPWKFVELMESLVAASRRNLNTEEGESPCILRKVSDTPIHIVSHDR
jgi:ankyrin repeat protein